MYGRHRKVINVMEEGGEWTLEEEDARVDREVVNYGKYSCYMFLGITVIMLLYYFFGGNWIISKEGVEFIRVAITNEYHWRFTLSMYLFMCMMQFSLLYSIAYQRREWREGKHTDHMLACYYCSGLEIVFLIAYFIDYITIIR